MWLDHMLSRILSSPVSWTSTISYHLRDFGLTLGTRYFYYMIFIGQFVNSGGPYGRQMTFNGIVQ